MMMYGKATITQDHLAETAATKDWPNKTGQSWTVGKATGDETQPLQRYEFKLFDDDGILYYTGTLRGDDHGVALLEEIVYDWGAAYAGTVAIFVDGELVIG